MGRAAFHALGDGMPAMCDLGQVEDVPSLVVLPDAWKLVAVLGLAYAAWSLASSLNNEAVKNAENQNALLEIANKVKTLTSRFPHE